MRRILVIEDERPISDLMEMNLRLAGYAARQVFDGRAAQAALQGESFDLALLDLMLPEVDGFALLPLLASRKIPTIVVSAREGLGERVAALRQGADDYLLKPFEPLELLARVEALLRRAHPGEELIVIHGVTIDPDRRRAYRSGQAVHLTQREFALLMALARRPGVVFTREQLLSQVWGLDYMGETRTVDVHIQRLRQKLHWEQVIATAYKAGYLLEEER